MNCAIKAYGERGYMLETLGLEDRLRIQQALDTAPPEGFQESVFGYDTMLILFVKPIARSVLEDWLALLKPMIGETALFGRKHIIPVIYDGVDLAEVARRTGLKVDSVITIHSEATYRVRMIGFSPGFPYLDGLDPRLHLERRESPRNRIKPGSVAIGGAHAGIYSVASPGGWHILGQTNRTLFNVQKASGSAPDLSDVFLLSVGDQVIFQAVDVF